jgi:hypothetical protein
MAPKTQEFLLKVVDCHVSGTPFIQTYIASFLHNKTNQMHQFPKFTPA